MKSGPGWTASSRNNRAAAGLRVRYDHEKTVRRSAAPVVQSQHAEHVLGSAQFGGQSRQGLIRLRGRSRCGDGQGQRQPRTSAYDGGDGFGLGSDAAAAEAKGEQFRGVVSGHHLQGKQLSRRGDGQPAEAVAAGDQDDRGPGTGQQRADLAVVSRVVQYHEHPPAGEQAPVERGALV